MANLAQTAVQKSDIFLEGGISGNRRKTVDAVLTLTGQGGATNKITADLFGLLGISRVYSARLSTDVRVEAWPSYDGLSLFLAAAGSGTPADLTGTLKIVVSGRQ